MLFKLACVAVIAIFCYLVYATGALDSPAWPSDTSLERP